MMKKITKSFGKKRSVNEKINKMKSKKREGSSTFEKFATKVSKAAGSTTAFLSAFLIVVVWAICGPLFDYSETWQLVINTGTTIITFLDGFFNSESTK